MKAAAELWRAIGLAACTWSRLEQHVEVVLIHLNQRKHSEKLYDQDHPIGFKRKIKLLKRWFNQHPALAEHRDILRTITTDMLSLSVTRNTFLHSILDSYDRATSTATFRAVRPTSDGRDIDQFCRGSTGNTLAICQNLDRTITLTAHSGFDSSQSYC